MRSSRRFRVRLARWMSVFALVTLVLSFLIITPIRFGNASTVPTQSNPPSGTGSRVAAEAPVPGPPEANLLNLEEVGRNNPVPPQAPLALPSSDRSRRYPLEPRNGKRVGDPEPRPTFSLNANFVSLFGLPHPRSLTNRLTSMQTSFRPVDAKEEWS
jgi:hypothetical protein